MMLVQMAHAPQDVTRPSWSQTLVLPQIEDVNDMVNIKVRFCVKSNIPGVRAGLSCVTIVVGVCNDNCGGRCGRQQDWANKVSS